MPTNSLIKEEINSNIVRISSEVFIPKDSKESIVTGLALPFDKVSRNEFTYDTGSIKKNYKTLEGASVLFNHNPDRVIGHVVSTEIGKEGMNYKIDLDPEEKGILNKMRRGDLNKVSIQCMFDCEKSSVNEKTGVTNAYINEFLELSVVSIPGFADTTAQLVESFKNKKTAGEKEMAKDENKEAEAPKEEPKKEEETKTEEEPKKEEAVKKESDDKAVDIDERIEAIEGRLEKIETFVKEQATDDDEDKKEEADDEDDEDEKREEAIKKDKQTVSTEKTKTDKTLSTKDIKKAFMEA
jgi:HK97 family phage prohead protease